MRFGEYLVSKNIVTQDAVNEALNTQKYTKTLMGRILRDLGHMDQITLNRSLWFYQKPSKDEPLSLLKEHVLEAIKDEPIFKFSLEHKVLPLKITQTHIEFICAFFRDDVIETCEKELKRTCSLFTVKQDAYEYLLSAAGAPTLKSNNLLHTPTVLTDDERLNASDPYTMLFKECIAEAKRRQASDIHIEPTESGLQIRLRIHGDLMRWKILSPEHREFFINAVKKATNYNLAISGKPQDFRASYKSIKLDIRGSSIQVIGAEKLVLRLSEHEKNFDLDKSGLSKETLDDLKSCIQKSNGLVLISGPTGSGKTSTLYALLGSLDHGTKNITTLENPVEHSLSGINQVNITSKLTFSSALRALLRQDPDVILVGEIRDSESAQHCFQAAATGHLVFSTLHANGATEVIERLLNLGIDRFSIQSNLRFSGAQRLVKKLCPKCSIPVPENQIKDYSQKIKVHISPPTQLSVRNVVGCPECELGIIGRLPILEYMREQEIHSFIKNNEGKVALSLQTAALKLALKGEIDINEVFEIA